jgi:peptidoglycan/LPS O-acetylase OafA/YrhL
LKATNRNKNLDFLRGMAILLVMAGHFLPGYFSTHIGWSGVDLFFVLSGFFVSGILFREFKKNGSIKPMRFLLRRGLKIWPLFYASILIQLCYLYFNNIHYEAWRILNEVFFIQNYFPGFIGVTWSLGVEEQFYILVAICFTLLFNYMQNGKNVIAICIVVFLTCLLLRFISYNPHAGYNPFKVFYPLHLRADSLCGGILISWFYHFKKEELQRWVNKNRGVIIIAAILFLSPLAIFSFKSGVIHTVGFSLVYLGYGFVVLLALFPRMEVPATYFRILLNIVAWVGFYSYAIYLFHIFIGYGVVNNFRRLTGISGFVPLELLIFIAGNIIFGWLISKLIEQPVLRWRDRVFPD